jgi:glutaminyl-peptide cyclotransferase
MLKQLLALSVTLSLSACQPGCNMPDKNPTTPPTPESGAANAATVASPAAASPAARVGPNVDENYAYDLILQYEKFGPKIPGTPAHQKAGDWLVKELKSLGLTVHEQKGTAVTFDKKKIPIRNVIAQINPAAKTRYLLSAHWDNRPFADQDSAKNAKKPVPGVNDGGSGVAVLLSIAKAVSSDKKQPEFGIDFAFWDAEDWGNPHGEANTYCLGSQLWAKNPVPAGYTAKFGINYDMVGRIGSLFPGEGYSIHKAAHVVKGLREAAAVVGAQELFPDYSVGKITDDHVFVMEGTGIPMADLIYMDPDGRFPPEWHTIDDTSKVISRDVLKGVAQTTVQLLFSQKP